MRESSSSDLEQRVVELKRTFDEAFSRPTAPLDVDVADFLIIVVGGQPHAVRVAELAGLEAGRTVVPVPVAATGFLGLSAIHGEPVPVFDLAVALGGEAPKTPGRWFALYRDTEPVALAFDALREIRRVPIDEVVPASPGAGPARHQAISLQDCVAHVIDIASVVALIRSRMHRR